MEEGSKVFIQISDNRDYSQEESLSNLVERLNRMSSQFIITNEVKGINPNNLSLEHIGVRTPESNDSLQRERETGWYWQST